MHFDQKKLFVLAFDGGEGRNPKITVTVVTHVTTDLKTHSASPPAAIVIMVVPFTYDLLKWTKKMACNNSMNAH